MALLESHPFRTTSISAAVITTAGDSIAQRLDGTLEVNGGWDANRGGQMFGWGLSWMGTPQVLWFRWLQAHGPANLAARLALHLTTWAQLTNVSFYAYKEALNGPIETWLSRYERRVRTELPSTLCYSLMFWTPAQAVNFTRVPLTLRPLYLNCMMVVLTAYLSISGFRGDAAPVRRPTGTIEADGNGGSTRRK